jgi:hypothetical protein
MPGKVDIVNNGPDSTITLNGDNGMISTGGHGANGQLLLSTTDGVIRIGLNANNGNVHLHRLPPAGTTGMGALMGALTIRLDADTGDLLIGGGGVGGELVLLGSTATQHDAAHATIHLRAEDAIVRVGGAGQDGDVVLLDAKGKAKMRLIGSHGHVWLGGNGQAGLLTLFPAGVENVTDTTKASMFLDGNKGDIVLQNADCAEDFDVAETEAAEPGAVMVIAEDGRLRHCTEAYDRRVAGVVSGAGEYRPGIVLDRRASASPRAALAMVGKAYARVDAGHGAIAAGDLLTTSPTPGHAMKAVDERRAFGAVLGKALGAHHDGTGLIPIVIALQ